jgi:hypothetical protein
MWNVKLEVRAMQHAKHALWYAKFNCVSIPAWVSSCPWYKRLNSGQWMYVFARERSYCLCYINRNHRKITRQLSLRLMHLHQCFSKDEVCPSQKQDLPLMITTLLIKCILCKNTIFGKREVLILIWWSFAFWQNDQRDARYKRLRTIAIHNMPVHFLVVRENVPIS